MELKSKQIQIFRHYINEKRDTLNKITIINIMNHKNPINSHFYDKNGFQAKQYETQAVNFYIDKENEYKKYLQWKQLLPQISDMKVNSKEDQRKLINYVRQGIDDSLRSQIWVLLVNEPIKPYQVCKGKIENKDINLDLERTFPTNKNAKQLGQKMKQVLNAIAVAIPDLGYCQGMNFIVGTILLRLSEEQAYKISYHILHWKKHDLLLKNLQYIHEKIYALEKLTKKHFPKLFQTLKQYQVQTIIYASSWFITIYTNCLPACYNLRILECYMLQGEKILYRVALQILKIKKKYIKHLTSVEDIVGELKNYDQFNQMEVDQFFTEMFERSISREQIQKYTKAYHEKESNKIIQQDIHKK